jgi:anti-sigma-K factor RskA
MSMDEHSGEPDGDELLVAEYALGLLDETARTGFAARLATEPALRRQLHLWRQRFAGLDGEFAEATPPADLYHRIEQRLFPTAARPGLWSSLAFWRGLAAACLVVAVVGVGFGVWAPHAPLSGPELAAALEAEGSNVKFVAVYNQAAGTVEIAAISGSPVPDRDFELWAIKGSAAPISMGVIPIDTRSSIPVSADMKQDLAAGTVFAVSLEPKGGSPTGLPTGPIVAKGAVTAI